MSELSVADVYVVNLPHTLAQLIEQHPDTFNLENIADLQTLATKLTLEDVFQFVYEQTIDDKFNEFVVTSGLKNILQKQDNITWLSQVKTQYDSYLRKREDMKKINEEDLTRTFGILESYRYYNKINKPDIKCVFFTRNTEETKKDLLTYKQDLYSEFYDILGFEVIRNHPVAKYILRLGSIR